MKIKTSLQHELTYSNKLNSLKTALMQDLLTGKVRVNKLMEKEDIEEFSKS
ncbi:hypothetical protein BMS3Abin03_01574 [bacterium BMS3Abin03]|nr:hypothetical protein BMS3Abin03_01574 [bacterium BMS3Abin03]